MDYNNQRNFMWCLVAQASGRTGKLFAGIPLYAGMLKLYIEKDNSLAEVAKMGFAQNPETAREAALRLTALTRQTKLNDLLAA